MAHIKITHVAARELLKTKRVTKGEKIESTKRINDSDNCNKSIYIDTVWNKDNIINFN